MTAVLGNGKGPDLPILDSSDDILLVHLLARCCLTNLRASKINESLAVLWGKALGCTRGVWEDERNSESSQYSGNSVDGDDPSPGPPSTGTTFEAVVVI